MSIILMFIGASPASTGGGVKTSTMAVLCLNVRMVARGRSEIAAFHRTINRDTMQRALAELEARGLLETQRTAGRTVTSDTEKLAQARQSLARKLVHDFYRQASALGLTKAELAALLEQEEG